jgi:hypothetical protein
MQLDISSNNLYYNGRVIYFPATQEALLVREIQTFTPSPGDKYYTLKENERLDLLAYRFYKDEVPDPSKYWWAIADANRIYNPFDLADFVGKDILIPDIQQVKLKS